MGVDGTGYGDLDVISLFFVGGSFGECDCVTCGFDGADVTEGIVAEVLFEVEVKGA